MAVEKDQLYVELMIASIEAVERYLTGIEEDDFLDNELLRDGCLLRLIVMGEAASKISEETKMRYPAIEWKVIKLARNFYVHTYDSVVWTRVWEVIKDLLHPLKSRLLALMDNLNKEN